LRTQLKHGNEVERLTVTLLLLVVVLWRRGLDVEVAMALLAVPLTIGASSVGHSGQSFGLGES